MNYGEMLTFVRTHADTDAVDAPDGTLSVYARMAYNDILSRRLDWPHLWVEYTLTTADGVPSYPYSSLSVPDIKFIEAIFRTEAPFSKLIWANRDDLDTLYHTNSPSNRPLYWTTNAERIVLYPTPSDVFVLSVRGKRAAAAFPTDASSVPDLPSELHDAIPWFMIGQYYLAQEEPGLHQMAMSQYETLVARYMRTATIGDGPNTPAVWGGWIPGRLGFAQWAMSNVEGR